MQRLPAHTLGVTDRARRGYKRLRTEGLQRPQGGSCQHQATLCSHAFSPAGLRRRVCIPLGWSVRAHCPLGPQQPASRSAKAACATNPLCPPAIMNLPVRVASVSPLQHLCAFRLRTHAGNYVCTAVALQHAHDVFQSSSAPYLMLVEAGFCLSPHHQGHRSFDRVDIRGMPQYHVAVVDDRLWHSANHMHGVRCALRYCRALHRSRQRQLQQNDTGEGTRDKLKWVLSLQPWRSCGHQQPAPREAQGQLAPDGCGVAC